MSIDTDSGEPRTGKGRTLEHDIVVLQQSPDGHTSVIPRLVVEIVLDSPSSQELLVCLEKAGRTRRIYPYVRYGMVIGNRRSIPASVVRLAQSIDFVAAIEHPLIASQLASLRDVCQQHVEASHELSKLVAGERTTSLVQQTLRVEGVP